MYNGIGLATPRGSGTNGYVVKNLGHLKPKGNSFKSASYTEMLEDSKPVLRSISQDIVEHNRKREIELKVVQFIEELEVSGKYVSDEIEHKSNAYRERLFELAEKRHTEDKIESEVAFDAKARQNAKFREAFSIKSDIKEGDGFRFMRPEVPNSF
ncbi:RNA-splicing factor [Mitosporidium daphniae]|uniref:CWF21 domain-containing protein n=1 Tax=Mitosporidium daphniae TaxID=1485682 RepID=A0A098VP14_9MICR|nr:uncharacterized protein DI09_55p190 [Mitosporidium daphniae]KGG50802.1 hypothetical protein DI09_55p190 [Mitosporidium daphniae]|eukprot:XP_013237229.1 uncharacterized protein DI09_55p190 [Mitosporidium daphniae]